MKPESPVKIGAIVGHLIVIAAAGIDPVTKGRLWVCRCSYKGCTKEILLPTSKISPNAPRRQVSCGCLVKDKAWRRGVWSGLGGKL